MSKETLFEHAVDHAFTVVVLAVKAAQGGRTAIILQAVEVIEGQMVVLRELLGAEKA